MTASPFSARVLYGAFPFFFIAVGRVFERDAYPSGAVNIILSHSLENSENASNDNTPRFFSLFQCICGLLVCVCRACRFQNDGMALHCSPLYCITMYLYFCRSFVTQYLRYSVLFSHEVIATMQSVVTKQTGSNNSGVEY